LSFDTVRFSLLNQLLPSKRGYLTMFRETASGFPETTLTMFRETASGFPETTLQNQ